MSGTQNVQLSVSVSVSLYFSTVEFSCGHVSVSSDSPRSIVPQQSRNTAVSPRTKQSFNHTQQDDYYYDDINLSYDYSDLSVNASDLPTNSTISTDSPINVRSVQSDSAPSVSPEEAVSTDAESSTIVTPTEKKLLWAFPTLPSISAKDNSDQRIVGGDTALPGEIPWQVLLYRIQG